MLLIIQGKTFGKDLVESMCNTPQALELANVPSHVLSHENIKLKLTYPVKTTYYSMIYT